jgi:hypothetical protein
MTPEPPPTLAAVLARLDLAELAVVAPTLVDAERINARDDFIRAAIGRFFADLPVTRAAKDLAAHMKAPPPATTAIGGAVAGVLLLSEGRSLSWSQIRRICDGWRGHKFPDS